jgi:hypothetical protein
MGLGERQGLETGLIGTAGEIDFLSAFITFMGFLKLIRENFLGCITFGAITGKGFQVFKLLKTWAMCWGCHDILLLLVVFEAGASLKIKVQFTFLVK